MTCTRPTRGVVNPPGLRRSGYRCDAKKMKDGVKLEGVAMGVYGSVVTRLLSNEEAAHYRRAGLYFGSKVASVRAAASTDSRVVFVRCQKQS